LTYVALILVPVVWWLVYRTPFGFHIRAAGFKPDALRSAGISPLKMKYIGSVVSGALCGLGGAHLALGYLTQFVEGMSAGRGFIAIAAVAFGNGNPWFILIACFIFGLVDGAAIILQGSQVPSHFLQMLPYIATVALLVFISKQQMKQELSS
jgi:simple sugar transport system permease protein